MFCVVSCVTSLEENSDSVLGVRKFVSASEQANHKALEHLSGSDQKMLGLLNSVVHSEHAQMFCYFQRNITSSYLQSH